MNSQWTQNEFFKIIPYAVSVCFIESAELTALFRTGGSASCCCKLSTASTDVNDRVSSSSSSLGPVSRPPTRCYMLLPFAAGLEHLHKEPGTAPH